MLGLVRWLSRRSLRTLHAWGGLAGWAAYLLSPPYRARLRANAALAGIAVAQRRKSVAESGRLALEMPHLWLRLADKLLGDQVRWQGAELVEAALGRPGGMVLLTPHMGSFEVAAQAYAERFGALQPITVLYRPARQPWLRELEETARLRPALAAAPASLAGVRQMLRALRRGETVGLLPDQVPPDGQGVWVPFFGKPAYTMTLAARLVQQTQAAVVLLWCERLPQGAGYVVHVSLMDAPLPPAGNDEAAALAVNRAMETLIRQHPGQYLWGYNRYKPPRSSAPPV